MSGTVLFCVDQLGVVIRDDATALVWIKVAIADLVPSRIPTSAS